MFGLRTRTVRPSVSPLTRTVRLAVERLEARDCPTPVMNSFSVTQESANLWVFSGNISDSNGPQNDAIKFDGARFVQSLSTQPDSSGNWSITVTVPSGTNAMIGAWAVDLNQNASNEAYNIVAQS